MIAGGIVLLGLFLLFARLLGGPAPNLALAVKSFIPLWLIIALVNMWVGVAKAGYSVRQELPILLLVFGAPAALAAIVAWRLGR